MTEYRKPKERIVHTFIEMLKEMPMEDIQVKDLARRAEISRSTFYFYYDSVWDVLQELENTLFEKIEDKKQPAYIEYKEERSEELSLEVLRQYLNNPELIKALNSHGVDEYYRSYLKKHIEKHVELVRGKPLEKDSVEARLYAAWGVGGTERMMEYASNHLEEMTPEQFETFAEKLRVVSEGFLKSL